MSLKHERRLAIFLFLVATAAACSPTIACAWSEAGHRIIASIVHRQLNEQQQAALADLLRQHPPFTEDFLQRMPNDVRDAGGATADEWVFQQAAVWPDIARGFSGQAKAKFHRPRWHYIKLSVFLTDDDRDEFQDGLSVNFELDPPAALDSADMNAVQAMKNSRRILLDEEAEAELRAVHLCWLLHDVGDIHQPLHAAAMFTRT